MSDLISRENLLNEINLLKKSPWYNKDFAAAKIVRKDAVAAVEMCIKEAPSVPQRVSHETTTFKPIATDTRGYACQFSCNACDYTVSRAYYMRPDQFDYNYCPYCGRPVESEDAE